MIAYQIRVTGVVQGIGYRYFIRMAAKPCRRLRMGAHRVRTAVSKYTAKGMRLPSRLYE